MNKIKNMETIFKKGDRVYDMKKGWGKVLSITHDELYPVIVEFKSRKGERSNDTENYTLEGRILSSDTAPTLSFTEYDYVKGGFSQERPFPPTLLIDGVGVTDIVLEKHFGGLLQLRGKVELEFISSGAVNPNFDIRGAIMAKFIHKNILADD